MFFPEKLASIRPQDKVLEIGPGVTPHPRSNAFLELAFDTAEDKISQRGGDTQDVGFGTRPIHFYDGNKFPFITGEFDYVICSHVIEHVSDPIYFLDELFRVGGGRGYLEYPLITYEYLYDFKVHLHFVKLDESLSTLKFLPKIETSFDEFSDLSRFFNHTLECGWDDLCAANKNLFFEGFEFERPFAVKKASAIGTLMPPISMIPSKSGFRKIFSSALNRFRL